MCIIVKKNYPPYMFNVHVCSYEMVYRPVSWKLARSLSILKDSGNFCFDSMICGFLEFPPTHTSSTVTSLWMTIALEFLCKYHEHAGYYSVYLCSNHFSIWASDNGIANTRTAADCFNCRQNWRYTRGAWHPHLISIVLKLTTLWTFCHSFELYISLPNCGGEVIH